MNQCFHFIIPAAHTETSFLEKLRRFITKNGLFSSFWETIPYGSCRIITVTTLLFVIYVARLWWMAYTLNRSTPKYNLISALIESDWDHLRVTHCHAVSAIFQLQLAAVNTFAVRGGTSCWTGEMAFSKLANSKERMVDSKSIWEKNVFILPEGSTRLMCLVILKSGEMK